jgi:hypothetical protein
MRIFLPAAAVLIAVALADGPGCARAQGHAHHGPRTYAGFDVNEYPGDAVLPALHRNFSYIGFWLNTPPGDKRNNWHGKREVLRAAGFGFLVLYNGHIEREFMTAANGRSNYAAEAARIGQRDAQAAIRAAQAEGFPAETILFLDIEEGGRMLPGQAAYLFAWSEAVARSPYRPGAYCSGQPTEDDPGVMVTTAQDIQENIEQRHLHPITLWIAQDACPPAPGCVLKPPTLEESGVKGIDVWQYAQSPRRKNITAACAQTYSANNRCLMPGLPDVELDLNAASSPDPSHGR